MYIANPSDMLKLGPFISSSSRRNPQRLNKIWEYFSLWLPFHQICYTKIKTLRQRKKDTLQEMKNYSATFQLLLIVLHFLALHAKHQVYVVHIGEHSGKRSSSEIEDSHHSYLLSVKTSQAAAKGSLIYSYKKVINGFSALLTSDEAAKLSEMEGIVSVIKSHPRKYRLQTTRSWEFVDFLERKDPNLTNEDLLRKSNYGKDVIVGVLDTGVWPESPSFSDKGMDPVPNSWKGVCQEGVAFNSSHCNRKLVGARYYLKGYEAHYGPLNDTLDYRSPRDKNGHGTHTASTVGGREVSNVSVLGGYANGTATGGAPLARLAIYKVCWAILSTSSLYQENTCTDEDMLKALDDAIADGVHVISISIVPNDLSPYTKDGIALGSLHAVKQNIVVICSAGNYGAPSTVRNVAPWILTVGASSIDRIFSSPVLLGNGLKIEGQTITPYKLNTMYPLVYAGDAEIPGTTNNQTTGQCLPGTLSQNPVQGKIVLCLKGGPSTNVEKGLEVERASGAGFVLQNPVDGIGISVAAHVLPGTAIFSNDSATILNYIRTSRNPTATIVPARTVFNTTPAPFMAGFSSAGPNGLQPNILKPDITAPGLNIVAAWSEAASPTNLLDDHRVVKYNILSGTSMSCPHVAATVALIKGVHPTWSSAAIRSALMTTASTSNSMGNPIADANGNDATPFHYGSGHFQPSKAIDPGLVYDANYTDYLLFLCTSGEANVDKSFKCPSDFPSASNLNYPSLAISGLQGHITFTRTVTNVGAATSFYTLTVKSPPEFSVDISPKFLNFSHVGEKRSFAITIKEEGELDRSAYAFGWYSWNNGKHIVRSPIVVSSAKN